MVPQSKINWETVAAIGLVPFITVGMYVWAYSFEQGYLSSYLTTTDLIRQYIEIDWAIFVPTLVALAGFLLIVMTFVFPDRKQPGVYNGFDVAALWSSPFVIILWIALTLWPLLPDGWEAMLLWPYVGIGVALSVACLALLLGLIRAGLHFFAYGRNVLLIESSVANWTSAMMILIALLLSVPWLGSTAGRLAAQARTNYQIIHYQNSDYAVIKRYGSNFITLQLNNSSRQPFIFNDGSFSTLPLEERPVDHMRR